MGRLAEARETIERCIQFQSRNPGPEHPSTLRSKVCKASILTDQNDQPAARVLLHEVLQQQRQLLGPEHEDTARTLVALGTTFSSEEDYVRAKNYYRKALAYQQIAPGPQNPETLATQRQLGKTLCELEQCDEAETLISENIEVRASVLGPGHPLTLGSRKLLATCLYERREYEEAGAVLQTILAEGRRSGLKPTSDVLLRSMEQLARIYWRAERRDDAIALLQEIDVLGLQHGVQDRELKARHNLGYILWKEGRLQSARQVYERALDDRLREFGVESRKTLETLAELAVVFREQGTDPDGSFLNHVWGVARMELGDNRGPAAELDLAYADWLVETGRHGEAQRIVSNLYQKACRDDSELLPRIEKLQALCAGFSD